MAGAVTAHAFGAAGRRAAGVQPRVAAGALTSRWSATDHYPGVTLLLSGLSFTYNGSYAGTSIRGSKPALGRSYLEYSLSTATPGSVCGVANASSDLSISPGSDSIGASLAYNASNGGYYYQGGSYKTFNGNTYISYGGAVIGMAVDPSAGLIWFNLGGTWVGSTANADPSSGVGGIPTPPGPLFPAAASGTGVGGFILNTGGLSFSNPVPAGYQAWG